MKPLAVPSGALASADVSGALALGGSLSSVPFRAIRTWRFSDGGDAIIMQWNLTNTGHIALEFGGIGFRMLFANNWTDLATQEAYGRCIVAEPSIVGDGGHVQVNRLNGASPSLLVTPVTGNSSFTPLQQWRETYGGDVEMFTDRTYWNFGWEGIYQWMVATAGFTQDDLGYAKEIGATRGDDWNAPTSITLAPDASRSFALQMFTCGSYCSFCVCLAPLLTQLDRYSVSCRTSFQRGCALRS